MGKGSFLALSEVAEALGRADDWSTLLEYARYLDQGLRERAFSALDEFLGEARSWDVASQRDQVATLLRRCWERDAEGFLRYPLVEGWMCPVLEQWIRDDSNAPEPRRWLALLRSDPDLLREALVRDPGDLDVRRALVAYHLTDLDFATHELPEMLIGTDARALQLVAVLRELIDGRDDPAALLHERNRFSDCVALLDEWLGLD